MELNKVYNEDCLIGMQRIPDKSIDMILCDLPYGTTSNPWDSVIHLPSLWKEYERIIKENGAIVLTGQQPFSSKLISSNEMLFRYEWIWEKSRVTGFLDANKKPLRSHENILIFYKKTPVYNPQKWRIDDRFVDRRNKLAVENYQQQNYGKHTKTEHRKDDGSRYPQSVLPIASINTEATGHSTQKPVQLFEYLIKTYTNEGGTVLDNCAGSGTTAIACINTNRNYIVFEWSPVAPHDKYFNVIKERIANHKPMPKVIQMNGASQPEVKEEQMLTYKKPLTLF